MSHLPRVAGAALATVTVALGGGGCAGGSSPVATTQRVEIVTLSSNYVTDGQVVTLTWKAAQSGSYTIVATVAGASTTVARGSEQAGVPTTVQIPAEMLFPGTNNLIVAVSPGAGAELRGQVQIIRGGAPPDGGPSDGGTPMGMTLVAAGGFDMGSPDDTGDADEHPMHRVTLNAFAIDLNETTNADYAACVSAGGCTAPGRTSSTTRTTYYGDPRFANYPVIYVSWTQADAFCRWRGKRLPTEAEWEKAARGAGDDRQYPGGGNGPFGCMLGNVSPNGQTPCVGDTTAISSYGPGNRSPYGAADMAGNVWEWVADWYAPGYYGVGASDNPQGPSAGTARVIRGGGWNGDGSFARVANRLSDPPGAQLSATGFRCAQ
jgi:formylglycine-generating enzyme required for sulfatase activity